MQHGPIEEKKGRSEQTWKPKITNLLNGHPSASIRTLLSALGEYSSNAAWGPWELGTACGERLTRRLDRLSGPATDIPHILRVSNSSPDEEEIRQLLGATSDEPLPRRILTATHMHVVGARIRGGGSGPSGSLPPKFEVQSKSI